MPCGHNSESYSTPLPPLFDMDNKLVFSWTWKTGNFMKTQNLKYTVLRMRRLKVTTFLTSGNIFTYRELLKFTGKNKVLWFSWLQVPWFYYRKLSNINLARFRLAVFEGSNILAEFNRWSWLDKCHDVSFLDTS